MPRRCAAYNCRGNYRNEPYTKLVSFPAEPEERNSWIKATPNDPQTLVNRTCASHFDCQWKVVRGGKWPTEPPSIFPGIPESCFKQSQISPRPTTSATSDQRREKQQSLNERLDKITDFKSFAANVSEHVKNFHVRQNGKEITMFLTDLASKSIIQFLHFREVDSPFGFLQLAHAEKNGVDIPKWNFQLQKTIYCISGPKSILFCV